MNIWYVHYPAGPARARAHDGHPHGHGRRDEEELPPAEHGRLDHRQERRHEPRRRRAADSLPPVGQAVRQGRPAPEGRRLRERLGPDGAAQRRDQGGARSRRREARGHQDGARRAGAGLRARRLRRVHRRGSRGRCARGEGADLPPPRRREPGSSASRSSRRELMEACNGLQIGPMGFGGKTTVLGMKVTAQHRLPGELLRQPRLRVLVVPAVERRARRRDPEVEVHRAHRDGLALQAPARGSRRRRSDHGHHPHRSARHRGEDPQRSRWATRSRLYGTIAHRARRRAQAHARASTPRRRAIRPRCGARVAAPALRTASSTTAVR